MSQTFNLPDVGEGLTEAEIVSWKVKPGDTVAVNDVICEIETAKSLVELPVPYTGVVQELVAQEGDTIEVGQPLIRIGSADDAAPEGDPGDAGDTSDTSAADTGAEAAGPVYGTVSGAAASPSSAAGQAAEPNSTTDTVSPQAEPAPRQEPAETQALVGSGPKADTPKARARTRATALDLVDVSDLGLEPVARSAPTADGGDLGPDVVRRASPPVRALAKRYGLSLSELLGTGDNGRITREDVEAQAEQKAKTPHDEVGAMPLSGSAVPSGGTPTPVQLGLLYDGPREERVQVRGVRKATALNVAASASTVPHVSVFKEVDITASMELRTALREDPRFAGLSVSPLLFAAKAIIWALRRNRQVNATWQETHYTLCNYVNLGIAAATPRGLVVPVIHDAQAYTTQGLAAAITALTTDAREGKTTPAQMQGGTVSITSIGSLGLDFGTPILPPGQAAIVMLGAVRTKPWVVDGQIVPRQIVTIGGSFDHRLIDGDLAGAFITDIATILEQPGLLLD
ncbi:dihydrolipoamide acetyltransferase family protein [Nesterenkonia ebinurensis]|uniref:dihydrolipoamide acetyltransferase family protein n=1 Tax=Nesterenkonia ebinurensis TaxID=2608252 RepID=UPI00123CF2A3|nr:dihydrolipoamide acetyltransferase family protein [Nesterenkonia ebinurensis]